MGYWSERNNPTVIMHEKHIDRTTKLLYYKYSSNRIMYVIKDEENVYFLHACQKQKGKAEKFDLNTALVRAKELNFKL